VRRFLTASLLLCVFIAPPSVRGAPNESEDIFELKIRPVLAGKCFKCHGGEKAKGGLRVDSLAALLKGGSRGPAVIRGDAKRSLMVQALRQDGDSGLKMPPGDRLPDGVVADFARWINNGAVWPGRSPSHGFHEEKHWAFEPVRNQVPPPDPSGWGVNPIDLFVAAKLRLHGLQPAGQAEKRVLLRRVYFDLLGVPPSPAEMAAFLADTSADAYAKVVDRLLASPLYGERWGRHWMDVVRYADTAGDNADYPIPEIRLYRDYIIDSFNADKPYDRFVQEQLAGDILAREESANRYAEDVIATGFLALSRRYATAPYEFWHLTIEDAIDTTGRAFLGLTMRCARCHDHKFDPLTQEDYYGLYGFFASTQFPWAGAEEFASMKRPREHFVSLLPTTKSAPFMEVRRQKIGRLEAALKVNAKNESAAAELARLRKNNLPPELPGAYAVAESTPVDAYLQIRGEVDQHGPIIHRNAPRFLRGNQPLSIPKGGSGRLQLARWLTSSENPLTARVMVNRIWQHHFGKGIVATPSNFGTRGEPPTHPELLDWLAGRFITSGWSIKTIHRDIVLSKTYQTTSDSYSAGQVSDPSNQWYWHHDRRRLEAEAIRDTLLLLGGNLNLGRPGPHPFPPIDQWRWTQHNPFKAVYPSNHRSVYLMTQRIQRHPVLALFDSPDTNTTTDRRETSTVPQQALFLMNDPSVKEQAGGFANRLLSTGKDTRDRIDMAHRLAWSRSADAGEIDHGTRYIEAYKNELSKAGVTAAQQDLEAWTSYARVMFCANEFVYVD
jgi:hypothetical protein